MLQARGQCQEPDCGATRDEACATHAVAVRGLPRDLGDSQSVTEPPPGPHQQETRPPLRWPRVRLVARCSCLVLVLAAAVLVGLVIATESPETRFVLAGLAGYDLALPALLVSLIALTIFVATLSNPRRQLAFLPGLATIPVGLVVLVVSPSPLVAVDVPNCTSPFVVDDTAAAGAIYRREGVRLEKVASIVTDDFYRPFASGGYDARLTGDAVAVRYFQASPDASDTLDDAVPLALPIDGVVCR